MPRRPRTCVPNGIYHVTSRGNRRQPIFVEQRDHELFLALFAAVRARLGWRCHGYCLMPNHYHLVVQTPGADLSLGMQRLNGEYAQAFNYQHRLDGHVFQGRFHSVAVESDWHLLELSRYLALNPVRAGLAASAAQWRWSSYRILAHGTPAGFVSDDVLALFGQDVSR
ncbi:MAG TPA: transposase, partial [Gaiellaceae bacterium]|nr:transposase [Gaiellaceae bacterium]